MPQSNTHKYSQETAGFPGLLTPLWAQERSLLLLKFLTLEGPSQSHQVTGTNNQLGIGSFFFLSLPQSWHCTTELHTSIPPAENWSPRIIETEAYMKDKPQSEKARPANTRDNQTAKEKGKNISNRNQCHLAPSEPSSPTTASHLLPSVLCWNENTCPLCLSYNISSSPELIGCPLLKWENWLGSNEAWTWTEFKLIFS